MTGFAEALEAVRPQRSYDLRIDEILSTMEPADAAVAIDALRNATFTDRYLAKVFARAGHDVSNAAIGNWRRRNGVVR